MCLLSFSPVPMLWTMQTLPSLYTTLTRVLLSTQSVSLTWVLRSSQAVSLLSSKESFLILNCSPILSAFDILKCLKAQGLSYPSSILRANTPCALTLPLYLNDPCALTPHIIEHFQPNTQALYLPNFNLQGISSHSRALKMQSIYSTKSAEYHTHLVESIQQRSSTLSMNVC